MSLNTKTLLFALLVCCISVISCGKKNSVTCGTNFFADVGNEITGLSNALSVWSTDPSTANCEKYKDALRTYFNALEGLRSCYGVGTNKKEFDDAVNEAKDDLDNWVC
jgi:hypothetical protein